jgi:hypothetical protein
VVTTALPPGNSEPRNAMHGAESEPSLSTGIRVFFNRFVFGGRDEERVLEAFHMSQQSRNGDLAKAGTLTLG